MTQRLTFGDKVLIVLSVLVLVFVILSAVGAEWCRHDYYCSDPHAQQYKSDCAANGIRMFRDIVYCWFHTYHDDLNAFATAILAVFTVILAFAARKQAILTRDALKIASEHAGHMGTVDIGKAQVRAYVSISKCAARFIEFHDGITCPAIQFTATNSGQSPARKFVWNITVEYAGLDYRRQRRLLDNWGGQTGMDIPSQTSFDEVPIIVPDMTTAQINAGAPNLGMAVIRIKVDFRYTDVFDSERAEAAFFSGVARKSEIGAWVVVNDSVTPMASPKDWIDGNRG